MTRRVRRNSLFERDLAESALYLGDHASVDTGLRFLEAAEETVRWSAETPLVAAHFESADAKLAELRVWSVKGFENYLIFFRLRGDDITLVRLLHGARDLDKVLGQ
jgi:toxin ParE1/3/4